MILFGGKTRQFQHPADVFISHVRLESIRWELIGLGAFEDASLERGYGYLLS